MKSRWRSHNGVPFLHLDYANFKHDIAGLRAEVRVADAEIMREPKGSVLDLRGALSNASVRDLPRQAGSTRLRFERMRSVRSLHFERATPQPERLLERPPSCGNS